MSKNIPLAPVNISYTLHTSIQRRHVNEIPIITQQPKMLYSYQHTFNLIQPKPKPSYDSVSGFASMDKFDPQDMGLPK